eukprot:12368234-Alexandrium_andersonii.AAC.1
MRAGRRSGPVALSTRREARRWRALRVRSSRKSSSGPSPGLDAVPSIPAGDWRIEEGCALLRFRLAPLAVRRDIALLGLVHRAALGLGPPQLQQIFRVDLGPAPARAR